MPGIKIAIIGAGSSYTPEIIEKLAEMKESLPVNQITLMDIDAGRLEIMDGFCKRFSGKLGFQCDINSTTDIIKAVYEADFVITQLRVGGNAARVKDEKIPMKYGLIGQETTGAGGFMKALRTVPVMLDIAHVVEKYSPHAWIINYTNPTGIVAEAVCRYSGAKIAGLCAGGLFPKYWASKAFGVDRASVKYDYFGLNHLNYAYNITIGGKPLSPEQLDKMAEMYPALDKSLIKTLRLMPSPYLQYYFSTSKKLKEMKSAPLTRGEEVQLLEKEIFSRYSDESQSDKPEALAKRGGGGYSEVAVGIIDALYNNKDTWMVVNVPNQGIVRWLPDDAVIETVCIANGAGIKPLALPDIPRSVWGLVSAVKNYEQLTVEAAVSGCRDTALLALLAHPLVRDYEIAKPLLEELLEANAPYLPQFHKQG